jgi:crossover junction endodeoxyribonuclease RusA
MVVVYYHEGRSARIDGDNLLKPIQDALEGLIYEDDQQITETICRKTSIAQPIEARGAPIVLLEAFSQGDPFLYVRIDRAHSQTDVIQ